MTYEVAEQLKDVGFPFEKSTKSLLVFGDIGREPTLSELIEACGDRFSTLEHLRNKPEWCAWEEWQDTARYYCYAPTPEEAVAKLWLALHQN